MHRQDTYPSLAGDEDWYLRNLMADTQQLEWINDFVASPTPEGPRSTSKPASNQVTIQRRTSVKSQKSYDAQRRLSAMRPSIESRTARRRHMSSCECNACLYSAPPLRQQQKKPAQNISRKYTISEPIPIKAISIISNMNPPRPAPEARSRSKSSKPRVDQVVGLGLTDVSSSQPLILADTESIVSRGRSRSPFKRNKSRTRDTSVQSSSSAESVEFGSNGSRALKNITRLFQKARISTV
jgi:hypothetical protein